MKINQLEEFVLNRIEEFKGNPIMIVISSSNNDGITYTFKNVPKNHDSRVNYAAALTRFMLVVNQFKFGIFGDETSDSIVKYSYLSEVGHIRRELISCNVITNYRVKLIPDKIDITCCERDLHPWIENKIFSNGGSGYRFMKLTLEHGKISNIFINDGIDNIKVDNIKDAVIRYYPPFGDNYLLDVLSYHDYLKNVVMGQMRASMNELSNSICRNNLAKMGDVDGDF